MKSKVDYEQFASIRLWSHDGKFGLDIPAMQLDRLKYFCREAGDYEVGGILAGHYSATRDFAIVTHISGPGADSKSGKSWFDRGVKKLQEWIDGLWHSSGAYYLGEWHFHPNSMPTPSETDTKQMAKIAVDEKYNCPEPVMIIVGGTSGQWSLSAHVYPRKMKPVPLFGGMEPLNRQKTSR